MLAPLRRLYGHKLYSLLNICGLGISLSVCLVLALYVQHELSYDDNFTNAGRTYQVAQRMEGFRNAAATATASSAKVAELFVEAFPEVEAVTRHVVFSDPVLLQAGETELSEGGLRYADQQFFRIFDFPVVAGDLATALDRPDGLVLTQTLAEKVFGTTDVIGRTLTVNGNTELVVTAVIDIPGNTHFNFTAMAPIALFDRTLPNPAMMNNWGALFSSSYLLLREGASIESLVARFPAFIAAQTQATPLQFSFVTTPLTGIHLAQTFQGGAAALTNLERVQLFAAIALCILLIAVVNFMNLATAGAARRAREVGVKVAMGAGRGKLIRQFLGESTLMVAVAMLVALVAAEVVVLPVMNGWLQWNLQLADAPLLQGAVVLIGTTALLGLLAGSYPAFYLTAWNATKVLRGELTRGRGGQWFRSTLVVLQFTISIALIIAAVVMNVQLRFAQNFDRGFDASNVMMLNLPQTFDMATQGETLLEQLRNVPGVADVSVSMASPLLEMRLRTSAGSAENPEGSDLNLLPSTDNLLQFYRIPLLAGRYPGSEAVDDSIRIAGPLNNPGTATAPPSGGVVLSESAARQLGWTPAEAIGRPLQMPMQQGLLKTTVIGVVGDTVSGVREGAAPMAYLTLRDFNYGALRGRINVRLANAADAGVQARIEQVWKQQFPSDSVQVSFLEQTLERQYAADRTQMQIFGSSATLAVLIACFGLFGLATFNTERRTKEIGVRKVMGGSVWSIVLLLTKDFSRLVLLSNVIAWPLAYTAMSRWLENFSYRIDLSLLVFIGSGLIALCVAWVTVGGTAAKAASAKPVLALRYE